MPPALAGSDASPVATQDAPAYPMDRRKGEAEPGTAVCPTDDEAITFKNSAARLGNELRGGMREWVNGPDGTESSRHGGIQFANTIEHGSKDLSARPKEPVLCPTDNEAHVGGKATNKRTADYVLRTQLAGGLAGCAAKTAVAPLDRVKILFQTSNPQFAKYTGSWFGVVAAMRSIYGNEGVRGLFRGHSATLLRIYPYASIKFVAYEQYRALIIPQRKNETSLRRFTAGALAGVTSVFITYPLEVIRVRLAFETKIQGRSTLGDIIRHIYNEHPPKSTDTLPKPTPTGTPLTASLQAAATTASTARKRTTAIPGLSNFYRGFLTTVIGMVPYAGMSFLTHDKAGDIFRLPILAPYTTLPRKPFAESTDKAAPLRIWAELISGGIAGMVSQTASYPLEVIRRRIQVGGAVGDGHRLGIGETAGLIFREKGFRGFWVGLSIGYVKVVPMVAVSFYVYERMKDWLLI